jgi:nicotinamide-nucleotide amidase
MAEALSPILPPEIEALTQRLLAAASDRKLMLATAESCTGGLIASLLTDVPGRSHVFERAFVTYSNEAKQEMLGVPSALLAEQGPVCAETARLMAQGALARSRADIVLSVTGWTEEIGDPDKPAGLVWFALARDEAPAVMRCERFGDVGRARIRIACLEVGLQMLFDAVTADPP